MTALKFCGLTRELDAEAASTLGATYVGAIFAGGPRLLTPERARDVLAAGGEARRVGVFGASAPAMIGQIARTAQLHVAQLHADPTAADVAAVRGEFDGEVWAVVRCAADALPAGVEALAEGADAILLDARVDGTLGGSGVALPWVALRAAVDRLRISVPIVLAGGLAPANVAEAVRAFRPDVVDVSSGVERSPGIKDHDLMRAFAGALAP